MRMVADWDVGRLAGFGASLNINFLLYARGSVSTGFNAVLGCRARDSEPLTITVLIGMCARWITAVTLSGKHCSEKQKRETSVTKAYKA